jgi:hypothetical protein
MKRVVVLAVALALQACAVSKQTYTADGRVGESINCGGAFMSWNHCYEKAGEKCGARGYDILDKTGDQVGSFGATSSGAYGTSAATRTLIIACK